MTLHELAHEWQAEGERLRARYGLDELAKLCEAHAGELLEAVRAAEDEALTLEESAAASGYSKRRLRELIAEGAIPNAGQKGRPRIRRIDLPRRTRSSKAAAFDASAHAAEVLR